MGFKTRVLTTVMKSHMYVKIHMKNAMKNQIPEYNLKCSPLVLNEKVEAGFKSAFNDPLGGVKVFVSPQGSGKTTYVRRYANRFIGEGGNIRFFLSKTFF